MCAQDRVKVFKASFSYVPKFKMEDFISAVKTLCADKNTQQLSELLNKNAEQLLQNGTSIDQVVGALDPEQHALAFLALL